MVNGSERLQWYVRLGRLSDSEWEVMAAGYYVHGVLVNDYNDNRLADGRAELTLNGSLLIHSYEKEDEGSYICYSEYRRARFDLNTFGM